MDMFENQLSSNLLQKTLSTFFFFDHKVITGTRGQSFVFLLLFPLHRRLRW